MLRFFIICYIIMANHMVSGMINIQELQKIFFSLENEDDEACKLLIEKHKSDLSSLYKEFKPKFIFPCTPEMSWQNLETESNLKTYGDIILAFLLVNSRYSLLLWWAEQGFVEPKLLHWAKVFALPQEKSQEVLKAWINVYRESINFDDLSRVFQYTLFHLKKENNKNEENLFISHQLVSVLKSLSSSLIIFQSGYAVMSLLQIKPRKNLVFASFFCLNFIYYIRTIVVLSNKKSLLSKKIHNQILHMEKMIENIKNAQLDYKVKTHG